jgi:hypothetical protein
MTTTIKTRTTRDLSTVNWSDEVSSILSSNAKLEKTPAGTPAIVSGISMAPAKRSGIVNVCRFATRACIAACVLWFAGRTMTASVRNAAINRTRLWHFMPTVFYARLHRELARQQTAADAIGARSFVRLNTASDIEHDGVCEAFPRTVFYDYSKSVERVLRYCAGLLAPNYFLSYSISEESRFDDVRTIIAAGGNVIVVIDSYYWGPSKRYGTLPARIMFQSADGSRRFTVECFDADQQDIRTPEFDGCGRCGVLRLKSQSNKVKEQARKSGFARPWSLGGKENSQRFDYPALRGTCIVRLK